MMRRDAVEVAVDVAERAEDCTGPTPRHACVAGQAVAGVAGTSRSVLSQMKSLLL